MKNLELDTHCIDAKIGTVTLMGVLGDPPHDRGNKFAFANGRPCANMFAENLTALVEDDTLEDGVVNVNYVADMAVVTDPRVPPAYLHDTKRRRVPGLEAAMEHASVVSELAHDEDATLPGETRQGRHGAFTLDPGEADTYDGWKEKNQAHPHSAACFTAAEDWMAAMEQRITGGAYDIRSYYDDCFSEINDGYTGFMYGAAAKIVSECWAYGETFRQAYNLGTQIGDEGERANAEGGVLNPALLAA